MKSTEFCYWLQGYFELSNATVLDSYQIKCILAHLNLVHTYELSEKTKQENINLTKAQWFCIDLYIKIYQTIAKSEYKENAKIEIESLKLKLNEVFKHEIDLNYSNQSKLNQIHGIYNNDSVVRC